MKKTILFLLCLWLPAVSLAAITPTQLTCEYLTNPQVVDVLQPRLAWVNIAGPGERGQKQTAWQIRVASSLDHLDDPDLWDSGQVASDQSNRIVYKGESLGSRQECWWQVRVWDRDGQVSDWSEAGFWRMGLLNPSDWQAIWIGAPWQGEAALPKPVGGPDALPGEYPPPAPLLRKSFSLDKPVQKAVAFVTGLGYFELYLNGNKVGNDVLVPNQTNYGKRPTLSNNYIPLGDNFRGYKVMYLAYDVSEQLANGENVLGGILGNGFYNAPKYWAESYGSPRFICQLDITYKDGTQESIISDQSWKASKSAILMDLVYHGEQYDARQEQPGWNEPGFDDAEWQTVAVRKAPEGDLVAHTAYTDKVTEEIAPIRIEKDYMGVYHVDFGVEISGWLRLNNVTAPAGHKIEIKYLSNLYSGDNSYIFRGEGPESYHARFNWFVFREVEIHNYPGTLAPENLTAMMVNTEIPVSAEFKTANPLFNQINKIWRRSQIDNMHGGIASDCPHRERSPYTGDGQLACATVMQNYDGRNFYHKWIQDILDSQNPETGYVPNGSPWQPGCGGGPAWGAAICIMPWEFYLQYGSTDMLADNYEGMQGYVKYMQKWTDKDGIMHHQRPGKDGKPLKWYNLGEWVPPADTIPDAMVHTFYLWRCADITAKTAEALGHGKDAKQYAALAERTRLAFHKRFYDAVNGTYGKAGGNILALRMGVPDDQLERVRAALRADIAANDGHLDTGIIGTRYFFEVLADNGMNDLAYAALNKRTEPSFGRWIELGSTTTREHWGQSGSYNHPMFGGGLVWFYRNLVGMEADPANPGYRHIIFKPQPVDELEYARYYNETPYGKAGICWQQSEGAFKMDVTVPVGCTATINVPVTDAASVNSSDDKGVLFVNHVDGYAVYKVGSGDYSFTVH